MNPTKQKKLEEAGWTVGSAADFLDLSESDSAIVEMKLNLANELKSIRKKKRLSQATLAKAIGSSQSRVAKMEAADGSVSMELFIRSLVTLGTPVGKIGKVVGAKVKAPPQKRKKNAATRSAIPRKLART